MTSPWRSAAEEAIRVAAAGIPEDATEAAARNILAAAYPFGPRCCHPYNIWLSAVRQFLATRFPNGEAARREQQRLQKQRRRQVQHFADKVAARRGLVTLPLFPEDELIAL